MSDRQPDPELSAFEARCRDLLGGSVGPLDAVREARLSAARAMALEAVAPQAPRPFRVPGAWLPVGTLAATAVLVLAVWWVHPGSRDTVADTSPVEDVELLVSGEGPDLYADDAAFYEWVADASRDPG
jgi:hypothetical protein